MKAKTSRDHLNDYTHALRQIELAGAAIAVLETMNTDEASQAVKLLNSGQKKLIRRMDAAAAKLGAPYPK